MVQPHSIMLFKALNSLDHPEYLHPKPKNKSLKYKWFRQ